MNLETRILRVVALIVWTSAAARLVAAPLRSEVDAMLVELDKHEAGLGGELLKLANESPAANRLLETYFAQGITRPENYPTSADKLAMLWKWGGLPVAAFQASGYDFNQLLDKYPLITHAARLLGAMRNEDGRYVLLSADLTGSRFDNHHKFIPANEIRSIGVIDVATSENKGFADTEAQSFEIKKGASYDVLILKQFWRKSHEAITQDVTIQQYRINKGDAFELIKEKTETISPHS